MAYHTETQTPYGIQISYDNQDGKITITWQESDGYEDNPPEYYRISYGVTNTADSKSVDTDFGFNEALSWRSFYFTPEYLYENLGSGPFKFYAKVMSRNDTGMTTSDWTQIVSVDYDYEYVPPTTAPPTTESPPKTEAPPTTAPPTTQAPPPPPTTTTTLAPVIVKIGGEEVEYTQKEVDDGTVKRDIERQENEDKYGCYMTNAQIERGDCEIKEEPKEEIVEEEKKEEVIIVEDEPKEPDTKEELSDDDVVVPEVVIEDEVKDIEEVKEEIKEVIEDIVIEEEIVEIPEEIIIVEPEEEVKDELDKEIPGDDNIREEPIQKEDEATDNKEPEEIIKEIEEVVVEELETEQVIEVLEEIVDVGVENFELASEDVLEVVSEVVQKSVTQEQPLTEEQTEVVAEVFNLEKKEDVAIVQEAVKNDEAVAEAVEVFVQKAIENKDVEDYTLADAVVEVQVEEFLLDPIGSFTDIQIEDIDLSAIGNDMTDDQKEKAQEVVVPVIIASQIVASVQVVPVRIRRRI